MNQILQTETIIVNNLYTVDYHLMCNGEMRIDFTSPIMTETIYHSDCPLYDSDEFDEFEYDSEEFTEWVNVNWVDEEYEVLIERAIGDDDYIADHYHEGVDTP